MATTYDQSSPSEALTEGSRPRRIVVCCDGTWQSATSPDPIKCVESNVARLSRAIAYGGTDKKDSSKGWSQIVYYDAGIGTGDIGDFEKKRQGGLGCGLIDKVIEAYNFIVSNYRPGDELFFFGFSRGAFTVRSVAGLASMIGIVKPCYMTAFIRHYTGWMKCMYEERKPDLRMTMYQPWIDFIASHDAFIQKAVEGTEAVEYSDAQPVVQVIGVWDTVGSLGVPSLGHWIKIREEDPLPYRFHDVDLNNRIKHAYQALALDERRGPFSPTLWKLKRTPLPTPGTPASRPATQLVQCWFPGVHVNIGGGNSDNAILSTTSDVPKGDAEQLATITYAWMIDRIRPHLALDSSALTTQFAPFLALESGERSSTKPPPSRGLLGNIKDYFLPPPRQLITGYARGTINDSFTAQYYTMGLPRARTPGKYHDPTTEFTTERIHPSVFFRQQATREFGDQQYNPYALQGWERIEERHGTGRDGKERKGWKWVKYVDGERKEKGYGDDWLWEFQIGDVPGDGGMEKKLIKGSWADGEFVKSQLGWA